MIVELINRIIPWWEKLLWRKWKYVMLLGALFYVLSQVAQLVLLGLLFKEPSDNSSLIHTKHIQRVAVHKVLSKWEGPLHSKVMKDPSGHAISLRGTRLKDLAKYFPNSKGKFTCFSTKEEIDFVKVNDDYCDCPNDGSDEPGTNACNNGIFYCEKSSKKSLVKIPSYRVNDGVCDCCDGSDEWLQIPALDTSGISGDRPLSYHVTECKDICTNS